MAKQGFLGSLATITLNSKLARLAIALHAETIMKDAILCWVKEAEQIIPAYQGEARGSIQPAADIVNYTVKDWGQVFNTAQRDNRKPLWDQGASKSSADLQISRLRGEYIFKWQSTVYHLAVNENANVNHQMGYRLINPGAYDFRSQANAEFERCLKASIAKFPLSSLILKNLKVRTVRIG